MKLRSSSLDMQQKWCCFTYTCQDHECHQRLSWGVPLYINQIFVFLLIFLPELTNARMIYSKIITRTGNSWARLKVPVYKLMWYPERLHASSLRFQFCQPQGLRLEVVHIMSSSLGPKPENLVPPDMHDGGGILLTPHVPGSAGIELRNRNKWAVKYVKLDKELKRCTRLNFSAVTNQD